MVLSAGGAQYLALVSDAPFFPPHCGSVQWVFPLLLYLVHNVSQLHMNAVIFSPSRFVCILMLREMFVHVQALQQRAQAPARLSRVCVSAGDSGKQGQGQNWCLQGGDSRVNPK